MITAFLVGIVVGVAVGVFGMGLVVASRDNEPPRGMFQDPGPAEDFKPYNDEEMRAHTQWPY